jgi:hypothetical protein
MGLKPTVVERAFELADTGTTVSAIKKQLQSEGFEKSFINGPTLLKELRRRIEASRAKIDGAPQS